ncbi:putative ribosome biogenesis protein [Clavispora lusitaniae]|uniref:Ribosome biogenesis protein n=3 Tax=Clavispora lusitaniae TaxID=36911 RepID=C4Y4N0_CLAL4|nr:uncharacterized protein CLUG_02602 [Clavispora lusitaniae ATCC 42720]KAF5211306.1 hypothetical protein E0198_002609 [Clavispora lusitaniae]EEQ38476.1 hypothetical protein CLUG_02602 [Clavispora lusitaniae ATCC 42720]KAF7580134.1 Ribosomal protein L1p/L10e family protein [Clavispora lusitaniae]OVF08790.1 putative ribosome biogenesis protein [Clavispora lusitaniae]QFZ27695.1 putative ribosome biogenesis protein [Clavispora lusitaniae]
MSFVLGTEAREEAKKSLRGIIGHIADEAQKNGNQSHHEPIILVLNTNIYLVKEKDFTPRIIPVTHKLHKIDEKTILLITRDSSFKEHFTKAGSPTEDLFHQIIPFQKIKSIGQSHKNLVRLYKENDIVLADTRIHQRLPSILGSQFYAKNKKVPFKVLMAKPEPGRRTHGKINQECDVKFVRSQVKAITGNASFIPPAHGNCINIVVGYSDWKISELLTNINDVILYLVDEKALPVGGLLRKVENLHSVLVRTSNSVALPVMKKREEKEKEESDMSDLDFD